MAYQLVLDMILLIQFAAFSKLLICSFVKFISLTSNLADPTFIDFSFSPNTIFPDSTFSEVVLTTSSTCSIVACKWKGPPCTSNVYVPI